MSSTLAPLACALLALILPSLPAAETLLLRQPSLSAEALAFVYAGDVWVAKRDGTAPRRLTVHPGLESRPCLSPDGRWVAFTGEYDGNPDVFVVPVEGGQPRRLTYHPAPDVVCGWHPGGEAVLFSSPRESHSRFQRLFTVALSGGLPSALPMPMAERGAFSPDGRKIAYMPLREAVDTWKRYRGGRTAAIWILDLESLEHVEIPHENATDMNPIWLGETVWFLSDRNHTMNLFAYDTAGGAVRQVTRHADFDVKTAAGWGRSLVYEQGGRLHLLEPGGAARPLPIRIDPDLPHARPQRVKAGPYLRSFDLSPAGARAVFEARGEIVTVPAEKGEARNLTRSPGVHDRFPAWSPDGRRIAWFSDQGGEYALMVGDQAGLEPPERIPLGEPTFYYQPVWSPDGKRILYVNKKLELCYVELEGQRTVKVDADLFDHPQRSLDPAWSPDGRWIAYTRRMPNRYRAVFLHDVAAGTSHQATDGLADAVSACFDPGGRQLYFLASTDFGLNTGWLDMSSYERPVRRSVYAAVLRKEDPSPLEPESDEERGPEKEPAGDKQVRIDLENLDQRIVALPIPPGDLGDLAAVEGRLFFLERLPGARSRRLMRYDAKGRKAAVFLEAADGYRPSRDGKQLLYRAGESFGIVPAAGAPKPGEGRIDPGAVEIAVDPAAEWAQIYEEAWRLHRDFFYAANMHGADWPALRETYRPFLAHVGHRSDLNYLLSELTGELVCGHVNVGGGDAPETKRVSVGLLGADYALDSGRYRFARILGGVNWVPDLRAPLSGPGIDVSAGDYLLAVEGREVRAAENVHAFFEGRAGKPTSITVNGRPEMHGARRLTVVPAASEAGLRLRAWVEGNRRKVEAASAGRVAYVYMPDTSRGGYEFFNRYYFGALDKQAVILDERFNGGGSVADYVVDLLDRPLLCWWGTREGRPFSSPNAAIFGPKAMVINEYAGSGGDAMPAFFRRRGLGKLVGKRTWGGLVGIYDYPVLIDGGRVTPPRMGIISPEGRWEIENVGVAPDVEVEMTPKEVLAGRDPQLEKALELVLEELERAEPARPVRPSDPVRVR